MWSFHWCSPNPLLSSLVSILIPIMPHSIWPLHRRRSPKVLQFMMYFVISMMMILQMQYCMFSWPLTPRTVKKEREIRKEDDAELMARVPEDDVWIRKYYPDPILSLSGALEQLREFVVPEMSDNMKGLVQLHLRLNMSTKKKVKIYYWFFVGNFKSSKCMCRLYLSANNV